MEKPSPLMPQTPLGRVISIVLLLLMMSVLVFVWTGWIYAFVKPGIAVTVLAFAAGAMALRREPSRVEKAAWLLLLGALTAAEISVIHRDRVRVDAEAAIDRQTRENNFNTTIGGLKATIQQERDHFDRTFSRMEDIQQAVIEANNSTIELASQVDLQTQLTQQLLQRMASGDGIAIGDSVAVTVSRFRDRVFLLSADILNFLASRKAGEPKDASSDATAKYDEETIAQYQRTFQLRVREARKGLYDNALTDKRLNSFATNVTSIEDIRTVADILGQLGRALAKPPRVKP